MCSRLGMDIHGPKLLGKDVLGLWMFAVGLAEASLVRMWRVACKKGRWDGVIPWMSRIIAIRMMVMMIMIIRLDCL